MTQQYLGRTHSTLHWTARLNDDVAVQGRGGIITALGPHLRGTCGTGPHVSTMWLSQVETVSSRYLGRIITALVLADMVLSTGPHV